MLLYTWIETENVAQFKTKNSKIVANEDWRPFVATVSKTDFRAEKEASVRDFVFSQNAIKVIFTALASFYGYLYEEDLTDFNPVALIRQKSKFVRKDQNRAIVRFISNIE